MVTGKKAIPAEHPETDAQGGSALLGLVIFGLAAGVVYFIVTKL